MKWKGIAILLIAIMPLASGAQLNGLMNKVKNKVNQRVDNKVDQAIDKALDDVEGKPTQSAPTATTATPASETKSVEAKAEEPVTLKSYSKFDFIPGERVLYTEDFAQDAIGELPMNWNASGKGEAVTIEGKTGKWLRLHQGNSYLPGNSKKFGENFTVEFDLIYFFQPTVSGYLLPNIEFGLFSSGDEDQTDNKFLRDHNNINSVEVEIHPGSNAGSRLASYKNGLNSFTSDRVPINDYFETFNKVLHYSIQVQKQRFRMWVNETKVYDIPRAINVGDTLNQVFFSLEGSNYKDEEIGLYLTNVKVATGVPDTRHKLIEEGKFSTTGILFDFQSATIKPESFGVIKEIAAVLKENEGIKIKVVGHTSNDGDDAANMELSKQRSASVKDALVKEYGIDAARIQTEGKGETQPVADNKTKEGKAQNRRVEFIKL
jgi:OmpA-OmpF porin, OOP family